MVENFPISRERTGVGIKAFIYSSHQRLMLQAKDNLQNVDICLQN
jgi:hypothetical protein